MDKYIEVATIKVGRVHICKSVIGVYAGSDMLMGDRIPESQDVSSSSEETMDWSEDQLKE